MTKELYQMTKVLRDRANGRKRVANLALVGVISVLLAGLYIFIFQSHRIAAQDVTQQIKLDSQRSTVKDLANLNLELAKVKKRLEAESKEQKELTAIVGSGMFKQPITFHKLQFWDKSFREFELKTEKLTLSEAKLRISGIEEANNYFASSGAERDFENRGSRSLVEVQKQLLDQTARIVHLEEEMIHAESDRKNNPEVVTQHIQHINRELSHIRLEKMESETKIIEINLEIESGTYKDSPREYLNYYKKVNEDALISLNEIQKRLSEYLSEKKTELESSNTSVDSLITEHARLEAEKHLWSTPLTDMSGKINGDRTAFYISTNIARFGIVLVTLFFAQIFLSIYKYSIRVSDFYSSRADAIELLGITNSESPIPPDVISKVADMLHPKVDFGNVPQASYDDMVNVAQTAFTKK